MQVLVEAILTLTIRLKGQHKLGPAQVFTGAYYFISSAITILATTLIPFRIIMATRKNGRVKRYKYTMEILIESGALYSITSFIVSVLLALDRGMSNITRMKAMFYGQAIITPITVRLQMFCYMR